MARGKVIVIEGGEGAGKTTVASRLKEVCGDKFEFLREPGATNLGMQIRRILLDPANNMSAMAEFLLFWASRAELIAEIALPALAEGRHVVFDRYFPSSFAYQIRARGINDTVLFDALVRGVCSQMKPDCYIFLDIEPELGMQRAGLRSEADRMEGEHLNFHHKVYEGYREFFSTCQHEVVDARKSPDEVFNDVLAIVCKVCA